MSKLFLFFFTVTFVLFVSAIFSGNYFILWGAASIAFAICTLQFSKRIDPKYIVVVAILISSLNFLLHLTVVLDLYRDGNILLFGSYGDDYKYLTSLSYSSGSKYTSDYGVSTYLNFPAFLNFLFSIGGINFVLYVAWFSFIASASCLGWTLYKASGDRSYLYGLIFLSYFPDIYLWSTTLYKEIWVASGALLALTVSTRIVTASGGFLALAFFRFVYILPIGVAMLISQFKYLKRAKALGLSALALCVVVISLLYFWADIVVYYHLFFSEARIDVILSKTRLSSLAHLIALAALMIPASLFVSLATPLPIYFEKIDIFDNLWWMTAASGSYLAYLLPWVLSYRKKDLVLISFLALAVFLTLSFLFLTNRHRFLISVLAVFMGGVMFSRSPKPKNWGYVGALVVFSVQIIVLKIRGQF